MDFGKIDTEPMSAGTDIALSLEPTLRTINRAEKKYFHSSKLGSTPRKPSHKATKMESYWIPLGFRWCNSHP